MQGITNFILLIPTKVGKAVLSFFIEQLAKKQSIDASIRDSEST